MASVIVAGDVSGSCTLQAPSAAGSTVLTLPVIATDTLAGIAATQTLTNKTLVAPALGTPASGVLTNCTGVVAAALPAGSVLQVVSTFVTNAFTTSSTSMIDITGMTVSITPRATANKIFVVVSMSVSQATGNYQFAFQLLRGATPVGIGTLGTTGPNYSFTFAAASTNTPTGCGWSYLDSPASVSALTYKIQVRGQVGTPVFSLNNAPFYLNGGSDIYQGAYTSSITVMEIQG